MIASRAASLGAPLAERRGAASTKPVVSGSASRQICLSKHICRISAPADAARGKQCLATSRPVTRLHAAVAGSAGQERQTVETFPRGSDWDVHKFGGTCVATAERIADMVDMIKRDPAKKKLVVVSAMGSHPTSPVKVTDLLLNMLAKATTSQGGYAEDLDMLRAKHVHAAAELLGEDSPEFKECIELLNKEIDGIVAMLRAVEVAGMAVAAFEDFVIGHGELWCARMTAAKFKQEGVDVAFMDARQVLVVRVTETGQDVDLLYEESNSNLDTWGRGHGAPDVVVCTGFIARAEDGRITTLKRNGSDYTATIMGALLEARAVTIWTDVNGVFSADPRKVKDAQSLEVMSYNEAWELAYFGANVLHPRSTLPAMKRNIPIILRNMFDRASKGTTITTRELAAGRGPRVKGFATIDNVSLIEVMGSGMVGVPGTASSIFSSVRDAGINVIMISQSSSEHSICFAVKMADANKAVECLRQRFKSAMSAGRIQDVLKIDNCTVLAAVGEEMASRKGISAKLFSALAKANVNVRATAQGASEYNITVVIDGRDSVRALKTVHAEFYSQGTPMGVGLVGPGLVGATLLKQLKSQIPQLRGTGGVDMRVLGIATSTRMLLSDTPIDLDSWEERFEKEAVDCDLARFGEHIKESFTNAVVVDCTASDAPPAMYTDWVRQGLHVVTPNKKMGSGELSRYKAFQEILEERGLTWHYETTVGAGLPVIYTLQHLVNTGDKIVRIEGIFSGTMSYLFNSMKPSDSFSEVVAGARAAGYTEPDPRDDLEGMDVARKVTILAREAGAAVELQNVEVQSLVPEELRDTSKVSVDELMKRLGDHDGEMRAMLEEADKNGEVLRYVGVADLAEGRCAAELKRYPKDHPFAALTGADNIIMFTTERYRNLPLIVRGPGAGAEVTAAGVFSDLLRLAHHLGATM